MSPMRSEEEESDYPFFEGDDSSSDELGNYGVAGDDYEGPPVFDDDQYEKEIVIGYVGKGFVDNYLNFQKDENNVSFFSVVLRVEKESMPVYDTDIEDVIEEEERFVEKEGFGEEEDNIEDVVVVANNFCSSMMQTTLNINFEEEINTKSHELISFEISIIIKVSQSSFKFLIRKKIWYLKVASMVVSSVLRRSRISFLAVFAKILLIIDVRLNQRLLEFA
nr:hypothetical protein [Tanacetum cinerariifolium]